MSIQDNENDGHQYQSIISQSGFATAEQHAETLRFKQAFKSDFYTASWIFTIKVSLIDMVDVFKAKLNESSTVTYTNEYSAMIKGDHAFVMLSSQGCEDDPWESTNRKIRLNVYGSRNNVLDIMTYAKSFPKMDTPRISWNYLVNGSRQEAEVFIEEPRHAPDSFYPYLRGGLQNYINEYATSTASVLLLRGDPGTGKTSFIQNLIWTMNTNCMITYEESLFQSDEMFVEFLTSRNTNTLIMEDADALLLSRERHGNQTMAKFLNVSDGLIRFPNKKLIISSNIVDEDKIDPALMRPGRCFDTPMFRKLTYAETIVACQDIERDPPKVHRDYSLAEILNGSANRRPSNVIGFTAAG